MKLNILSPNKKIVHEIVWIEAETPTGNYVIQPGHVATTLIILEHTPVTYCLKNGKQEVLYPTHNSIMQVTPMETLILLSE
jgi:F0F1-type ATP synthase epsilon subunit